MFLKFIPTLILILVTQKVFPQKENQGESQMFAIYAGPGLVSPIGAFSDASNGSSDFKARPGFSYRGGFEWYFDYENCVSLDGDLNLFLTAKNQSLNTFIQDRINSTGKSYIYTGGDTQIEIFNFLLSYSRVIPFKQFLLQPKLGMGLGDVDNSFSAGYVDGGQTVNGFYIPSTSFSTITYSSEDRQFFVVKPEISLKYAKRSADKVRWMLAFNLGYYYMHASMSLFENNNGVTRTVKTLNGPISCVTGNVTFSWTVRRDFFVNMFRYRPSFFFF